MHRSPMYRFMNLLLIGSTAGICCGGAAMFTGHPDAWVAVVLGMLGWLVSTMWGIRYFRRRR